MVLIDENIDCRITHAIKEIISDVIVIAEQYPGITDEEVMELSINPPRIIITEDKDFGEWVFAHQINYVSVILIRYRHQDISGIISVLHSLLKNNFNELFGKFTTVTTKKVRMRPIK